MEPGWQKGCLVQGTPPQGGIRSLDLHSLLTYPSIAQVSLDRSSPHNTSHSTNLFTMTDTALQSTPFWGSVSTAASRVRSYLSNLAARCSQKSADQHTAELSKRAEPQWLADEIPFPGGRVQVTRKLTVPEDEKAATDSHIVESTVVSRPAMLAQPSRSSTVSHFYDRVKAGDPGVMKPPSWDQIGTEYADGLAFVHRRGKDLPAFQNDDYRGGDTCIFAPRFAISMGSKPDEVTLAVDGVWFSEKRKQGQDWVPIRPPTHISNLNSVAGWNTNMSFNMNPDLAKQVSECLSKTEGPDWEGAHELMIKAAAQNIAGHQPSGWRKVQSAWTLEEKDSDNSIVGVTPNPPACPSSAASTCEPPSNI